jgi:signal transduction histidine kinase
LLEPEDCRAADVRRPSPADWSWIFLRGARSPRGLAVAVTAAFIAVGSAWVIATDLLVFLATGDRALVARVQVTTDWAFVLLSAIALYVVTWLAARKLVQAHAVMSAVVDSIADGLLVLGADGHIVHASPSAARMLGCNDPSELTGLDARTFADRYRVSYVNGARIKPGDFISQRVFKEAGPLHHKSVLHPPRGRETFVYSTAAAVRRHPADRAALVVAVLHDITDSEGLDRMRDTFFAAAAHALKTPVAIIKANVQVMAQTGAGALAGPAAAIERQCGRIDRLVQNLLIVSRARAHSLRLHTQAVLLEQLLRNVAEELRRGRTQLEVRVEIDASPTVWADGERLATALRNLGYEAIDASMPGTPLTLKLREVSSAAEVQVVFEALPLAARTFEGFEEYNDGAVSRCATETIIEAHGGESGTATAGPDTTLWVQIPKQEAA